VRFDASPADRIGGGLASLLTDFRHGLRRLTTRRGYSSVAVATVAIALAAASALFAIVDGVLLRHLPFRDPDRLVAIWQTVPGWKASAVFASTWDRVPVSIPEYRSLSAGQDVFDDVAIWSEDRLPLATSEGVDYVRVTKASWTMLRLLGVSPALGRYFSPNEDMPNAQPVVMLSNATWHDRYGGATDIVGRTVRLDHTSYLVIGVLPPRLTLDREQDALSESSGGAAFSQFWIPAGRDSAGFHDAQQRNYQLLARLKPGVSIDWATQAVDNLLHPTAHDRATTGTRIESWQAEQTRAVRKPLLILLAAACFLLLIACANVALLTLGESATRQHEIAIRVAVGAGHRHLFRQLLAESIAACAVGAALALPLSVLCTRLLIAVAPLRLSAITVVRPDIRVLAFGLGATALSALVAGTAPAMTLLRVPPAAVIQSGAQRITNGRGPLQQAIIAFQTAVAIVLLIGAALLFRTSEFVARVNPGFDPDDLVVVQLLLPTEIWADTLRSHLLYADIFARLAALPAVSTVSGISAPPIVSEPNRTELRRPDEPSTTLHAIQYRAVAPRYFRAMRIRMREGRDFTDLDQSATEDVAIVSSSLVRRDFAGEPPIGQRVQVLGSWRTIIGVVDDVHFSRLSDAVEPTIYVPFTQLPGSQLELVIRTAGDPAPIEGAIRSVIRSVAPTVGVDRVDVIAAAIRRSFAEERYRATLMMVLSIIAAVLTAIGTYGVTARSARGRRREAAIRFSLGASSASVMRLLMGTNSLGLLCGAPVGIVLAMIFEPRLRPYLFQISPTDPRIFGSILIGLTLLIVGANWLAIRSIHKVDLATVLRSE